MSLPRITHVTNLRSIQLSTEQLSYGKNYTLQWKTDLHYNSLRKKIKTWYCDVNVKFAQGISSISSFTDAS